MLLANQLQDLGDIKGTMYDFENSGDILAKHTHTEEDVHITIVARGKVKAQSHDWEQVATAGQIINFRPREPHEIIALEDNTRIFNIIKKHNGVVNETQQIIIPSGVPEVKIMAVSNVFTRLMTFANVGDVENGHTHTYNHATLVSSGSVRVAVYDNPEGAPISEKTFTAPSMIYIPKDKYHKLTSLEPNTVCACIHALRTIDEDIIDPAFLVEQLNGGNNIIANAIQNKYGKELKPFSDVV